MADAKEKLEYLKRIYQEAGNTPVSNREAINRLKEHYPGENIDQHNDLRNNQQRLKAMGIITRGSKKGEWIYVNESIKKNMMSSQGGKCIAKVKSKVTVGECKNDVSGISAVCGDGEGAEGKIPYKLTIRGTYLDTHSEMSGHILSLGELRENYNGLLLIPNLQRDYVWGGKEWERLWSDIIDVYEDAKNGKESSAQLFMGTVTFKSTDDKYEVIDGQQRLTTLTVLMDMLCDQINFARVNNKTMRRNQTTFLVIEGIHVEVKTDLIESDNNDSDSYSRMYNFFAEKYAASELVDLLDIIDYITNRLFFHVETVTENANETFERLNATGEPLAYTDLILNHLISLTEENKVECIRDKWEKILRDISIGELPPQTDKTEEDMTEEAETLTESESDEAKTEAKENEDELENDVDLKPLKIKKFFNALYNLTLPRKESFPETVDDFMRMIKHVWNSFGKPKDVGTGSILDTIDKWKKYYLEYVSPDKVKSKYACYLYYLRTIGTTALIPTVMRTLYRVENEKFSQDDAANIFHALVTSQILRGVYTERDNTSDIDKKLRIADYIYIAAGKKYQDLLKYLISKREYLKLLNKDEKAVDNDKDDVVLWNLPYSSGMSKVILAIAYDCNKNEKEKLYRIEKPDNRFQVEHMLALKASEKLDNYGYTEFTIDSFWNLNLLESTLNESAGDKSPKEKSEIWNNSDYMKSFYPNSDWEHMKVNQTERLKALFMAYRDFCKLEGEEVEETEEVYVLSYIQKGNHFVQVCTDPKLNAGENENGSYVYRVSVDNDYKIEPREIRKENKATAYYFQKENGDIEQLEVDDSNNQNTKSTVLKMFGEYINEEEKKKEHFSAKEIISNIADTNKDANKIFLKNLDNSSTTAKQRLKNKELEIDGNKYYVNTNTDISQMCKAARLLYSALNEKGFRLGFWVRLTRPEMHYIQGKRMLTLYRNVGDRAMFENYVMSQATDTEEENDINPAISNSAKYKLKDQECYLSVKECSFSDMIGKNFHIPEYQRKYVWGDRQFSALIDSLKHDRSLGTIILYKESKVGSVVVDGQQRLTSLGSLYWCLTNEKFCLKNEAAIQFFDRMEWERRDNTLEKLMKARFQVLTISEIAPVTFQYKVFGTINGCGKRLTLEEKVRNYLIKKNSNDLEEEHIVYLKNILCYSGFIKAYTEMRSCSSIPERELYDCFKKETSKIEGKDLLNTLGELAETYRKIKGIKKQGNWRKKEWEKNQEISLWISMYSHLEVNTADALLLSVYTKCEKGEYNPEVLAGFMRRLVMMYFLLYVDDPNGYAKKSINRKLPGLIKDKPCEVISNELVENMKNYVMDEKLFNKNIDFQKEEYIFRKLEAFDLARDTRKSVSRFILMLCELWYGLDSKTAIELLNDKKPCEIEHIFPANPSEQKIPENVKMPESLFRLQNVCLLEPDINKAVGNKMLIGKNGGKLKETKKETKTYFNSRFLLPMIFYIEEKPNSNLIRMENNTGYFGSEQAKERMKIIKEKYLKEEQKKDFSFYGMLKEIVGE